MQGNDLPQFRTVSPGKHLLIQDIIFFVSVVDMFLVKEIC
jgi:hypothetical protein